MLVFLCTFCRLNALALRTCVVEETAGELTGVKRVKVFRKLFRDRESWEDRSAAGRAAATDRYGDEEAIRARLCRLIEP